MGKRSTVLRTMVVSLLAVPRQDKLLGGRLGQDVAVGAAAHGEGGGRGGALGKNITLN